MVQTQWHHEGMSQLHPPVSSRRGLRQLMRRGERSARALLMMILTAIAAVLMTAVVVAGLTGAVSRSLIEPLMYLIIFLTAVPIAIVTAIDKVLFSYRFRGPRRDLQNWAQSRGWHYIAHGRDDARRAHPACRALDAINATRTQIPAKEPFRSPVPTSAVHDVATGKVQVQGQWLTASTFTNRVMNPPESMRRFMTLELCHSLPPLIIEDASMAAAWKTSAHSTEWAGFNRRWIIDAPSRSLASDLVHGRVMELVGSMPDNVVRLDAGGDWLLVWLEAEATSADLDAAITLLTRFYDLVPRRHLSAP